MVHVAFSNFNYTGVLMSNFLPVVKLEFINDKQVPAVTSQQLAEAFGKQHAHVMRDIRETTAKCSKLFSASNFGLAEYLDEQGKSRPYPAMWRGFVYVLAILCVFRYVAEK
jgi:Rha family phage regulatory protein